MPQTRPPCYLLAADCNAGCPGPSRPPGEVLEVLAARPGGPSPACTHTTGCFADSEIFALPAGHFVGEFGQPVHDCPGGAPPPFVQDVPVLQESGGGTGGANNALCGQGGDTAPAPASGRRPRRPSPSLFRAPALLLRRRLACVGLLWGGEASPACPWADQGHVAADVVQQQRGEQLVAEGGRVAWRQG